MSDWLVCETCGPGRTPHIRRHLQLLGNHKAKFELGLWHLPLVLAVGVGSSQLLAIRSPLYPQCLWFPVAVAATDGQRDLMLMDVVVVDVDSCW